MLAVTDLHSGYGRIPILNGLSLTVGDGECLGILGHNGMGKTTLLRTLMGFIPARRGRVVLNDIDIIRFTPERRAAMGLGFVPQGREIFPALTVRENLLMGAQARKDGNAAIVAEVLERFPRLQRLLDRMGGALSGGEQQLLAIARCLCGTPTLMLLDEPTEGIQPSIIDEIAETLRALRRSTGISIVLVEQNLDFIREVSDRVVVIQRGTITQSVAPEHLADPELISEFVGIGG